MCNQQKSCEELCEAGLLSKKRISDIKHPFITHIGENYLYRGFVETELKEIDKSYAYKLLSHKIEYIIVSQIVNDKGSKCGMLILEYTDASVIDEFAVKQKLHKASQECAALLTLSKHSCGNAIGIFNK